MSKSRYRFGDEHFPYFMTDTVVAWLPLFSHIELANILFDSWRFLQRERSIEILAYVVMENHIHWIAVGEQLSARVGQFKSFTARSMIDTMQARGFKTLLQELHYYKLRQKKDQDFQVWQEGSHPQMIDSDQRMWQKIEYIHHNPLRRGFVRDPLHWVYSSASAYAGGEGPIEVCTTWR